VSGIADVKSCHGLSWFDPPDPWANQFMDLGKIAEDHATAGITGDQIALDIDYHGDATWRRWIARAVFQEKSFEVISCAAIEK